MPEGLDKKKYFLPLQPPEGIYAGIAQLARARDL